MAAIMANTLCSSYVMDLAFLKVPDSGGIEGLNWRLMLGSAGVPAIVLAGQIYHCCSVGIHAD